MKSTILTRAAIASIIGAAAIVSTARAEEAKKVEGKKDEMVHAMGANACKGKGGCHAADHDCAGKNACKGKSFTEMSKADCEKLAKKNKKVTCEPKEGAGA